ncbi:hypothetical protein N8I77_005137 [Diaporthe amygdali]|uniref:Uncharacterized protein n=1 Tax=Phomopsis amygdali TaxID=1214568 RepID=A0AAD9W8J0_PHOAM|nr:hypothetical protein N8I77_005137 [Diaporthe amygdali]
MFASGGVMAMATAPLSQESHLLSPETSAAGSDNGQLEDLRGESFPRLDETELLPPPNEAAAANAAAPTPSHRQQTSLKTPSSLPNPRICSTSASKSKSTSLQASQPPSKSKPKPAKMSSKEVLSASRRAAPINVQIVRVSSPAPPPSSSSSSSSSSSLATQMANGRTLQDGQAFTMNLLPMTKIKELCLHAAGHARRHFDAVLDGSRFEARDKDGHVFQGHETISEEILSGETIYLVENGLDARGAAKVVRSGAKRKTSSSRERGRLLCLKSLDLEEDEVKPLYRTPSVSSRASSSRGGSKEDKAEPKMTPSQKALAIAQRGRTPRAQEAIVEKKVAARSAARKSLPSPGEIEDFKVAASTPSTSAPPQPPLQPTQQPIPPILEDSQIVIPDSQDPFSQGVFSQQSIESHHPDHTGLESMPKASDAFRARSRSPRVKAPVQPTLSISRSDPYDISSVLFDEDELSDERHNIVNTSTKMSSSVRKLGSSAAKHPAVAPPPVSLPSPSRLVSSSHAKKAVAPDANSKPSTPSKKATPIKADPSSPAGPLPSSPTMRIAAAQGRQHTLGKTRQPQLPSPGQLVIHVPSDSSDEADALIDEVFREQSSSAPAPSLPWSAPPLRAAQDELKDVERHAQGRRGSASSTAGEVKYGTLMVDKVSSPRNSPKKPSKMSSPGKMPVPSPGRKSSQGSPVTSSIIKNPSKKEEATIVHDSSSAEISSEENIPIIEMETSSEEDILVKREPSSEEDISRKRKLAAIPTSPKKLDKEQQPVVIEVSSGSDSDIEPSIDILEDDKAELPSIDVKLATNMNDLPSSAKRSPSPKSLKADPIKPEVVHKEEPPLLAQASKRKRSTTEDYKDEERERKRFKKEAKKVKKREKKFAALQEERKKYALEEAHRRALELEIVVSSPIKRESSIAPGEEADDDDRGLGSSAYGDDASGDANADADAGYVGVPLDGDDKNDSLSSKEAGDQGPSWRKLSKRHLSSPESSQDNTGRNKAHHLPTSTPAIIEAQLQQCVEERFHRMPFDDWAFLESTLGQGAGCGYSPLEVHNRVHLDMVHQAQYASAHTSGEKTPDLRARDKKESDMVHASGQAEAMASTPGPIERSHSQRSGAPSPKKHGKREKRVGAKTHRRLEKERARKKQRESKVNSRYHHDFRGSRAGSKRKQRHRQKGH